MHNHDDDSQFRYDEPTNPKEKRTARWQHMPATYRTRTIEEANIQRAQIINHPGFDKQMEDMIKVMGKENAEKFLAKVLENQKYEEISPANYKKVYV